MSTQPNLLVINPGSTSTKIAVYEGQKERYFQSINHKRSELAPFPTLYAQRSFRFSLIERFLKSSSVAFSQFDLIMGRGGLLHPLSGGVYRVNDQMLSDLEQARYGEHASNLGAPLAARAAERAGCQALIADPVVVDELSSLARYTGIPQLQRKSIFHALNQKIAARNTAEKLGKEYEKSRLIIVHLGGGISVGAHEGGKVIDVNNALDGDGPFSPERSGSLPAGDLVRMALHGKSSEQELLHLICGNGGLAAYLGTSDTREVERAAAQNDTKADELLSAMVYQISKEVGAMATVLNGCVDAIVLTGGMAHSERITGQIIARCSFIAPIHIIPGEREMLSLAENGCAVYHGKREVLEYERVR